MTPEHLSSNLRIDDLHDGGAYSLPEGLAFEQTNLFFKVARAGQVFIKIPTDRGLHDYDQFVKQGRVTDLDVRRLEDIERFDARDGLLAGIPALQDLAQADPGTTHFLAVHWYQFDRLRRRGLIGIPQSRFATIDFKPAIFQQRIPGATLWEMFDFEALRIRQAWQAFRPAIAAQLSALLESGLREHVDWNIKNFVFHGAEQRLYYVDSKPTTFVARSSNDHNLAGIRSHFLA